MKWKIVHLLLSIFIFLPYLSRSQADSTAMNKPVRPKVGFVMSGGGAKGFAYIGLIKVMHEAGLEVDYVAGSSMGSIVAGMYALGYHPDTMIKVIKEQNWDMLLTDKIDRKYIAYEEKVYGETYIMSFPVSKKGVSIKAAMYEGQEVNLLLNRFYSPAYNVKDFNKLQTPFLCIGTDLITGDAVVLDKGYMPMAIRASMSIPAYFSPTFYDNKYLVDGGVVDNYPVEVVKKKGANYILGADVQSGLYTSIDEMNTMPSVIDQLIGYHRVKANEIGYKLTNMYVHFKMPYGMMDFTNYDSIIALGEQVGRANYAEIKKLADSLNAIEFKPLKKYTAKPLDSIYITNVIVQGNEKMPQSYFDNSFGKFKNTWVKLSSLEEEIHLAYGSRFFTHVFYEFDYHDGKTDLVLKVKEADAGYLSVGVHYDSDYEVGILLNGSFRNLFGRSSKIFADAVIGPYPRLRALYMKDNGGKPGYGADIDIYYFGWTEYASPTNPNAQTGDWFFTNYTASAFASSIIKNRHYFRIGGEYEYFRFKTKMDNPEADSLGNFNSYGNLFFSFNSDTRDRSYLFTRGILSSLKATYVMPLSKDWVKDLFSNSFIIYFNYEQGFPFKKRFSFIPGIFLGATFSKNYPYSSNNSSGEYSLSPLQHWFYMGGQAQSSYIQTFRPFTGVQYVQRYGMYQAIFSAKLQYNFFKNLYFTAKGDVGSSEFYMQDIFQGENLVVGYGGTLSYDSFIGPLELSMMGSNIYHGVSFYVSLGYWF